LQLHEMEDKRSFERHDKKLLFFNVRLKWMSARGDGWM